MLATTNGALAVVMAAKRASHVLIGCLLNLDAVIDAVRSQVESGMSNVLLVCAGTDEEPALEDAYAAGRISAALDGPRTDAALIVEAVSRAYKTPLEALEASAGAEVLRSNGLEDDIAYCARTSELACVPLVVDARAGVATVADTGAKWQAAVVDVSGAPVADDSDTVNA